MKNGKTCLETDMEVNEKLIKQYTPLICKIANQFEKNKESVKDLKQELYLKMIQCTKNFDENRNVKYYHYLKACCYNQAYKWIKQQKKVKSVLYLEEYPIDELELLVNDTDNENDDELVFTFLSYYRKHKFGTIAKLKYIYGYDTKFIAEKKGISRDAINKKLREFIEWFKNILK